MANKHVTVRVVLHQANDPVLFHFETDDLPMGPDNHLYFWNCIKGGRFRISYVLDDTARPGFRFPVRTGGGDDHLRKALWVQDSNGCPQTACEWEQFEAKAVKDEGLKLIVMNSNSRKADFWYSLRVTDGNEWLLLDPGGTNGNGGEPPLTWAAAAMTGAVVGLGSAAFAFNAFDLPTIWAYGVGGAIVGAIFGFLFERR